MIHITWKKERIQPLKKVRIPKLQSPRNASLHPISSISLYILAHKIRLSNHISFENAIIEKKEGKTASTENSSVKGQISNDIILSNVNRLAKNL